MAVGSIDNKINGKNSKNRYTNNKKKKKIKKSDAINELIYELEQVIILKERELTKSKKKNKKKQIFLITISIFIILLYLLIPKIHLYGSPKLTIDYNTNYQEKGYKAKFLWLNITNKIKVKSNLVNNKIGKYEIEYYLKYGILKFKKIRKIDIIDDITPNILVENEIINICPNDEIPDIKFTANDEYDGDISDNVVVEKLDDMVILSVSDSSNNTINREIPVDREDKTKPEIVLKGDKTIYLNVGTKYNEPGYTAKDNCDGDISDKVKVSGNVETNAGTYKLTYSVSDNNDNKTEVTRTIIVRRSNLYNDGSIGNGVIYLTFDDGPNNGTTNVILDILKEEGVKATFFVTCNGPDYLIKRIYDEGHTLALHTCTHNYGTVYSSVDNYFNDLNNISNRVKNITGYDSKIIRFPGGSSNTVSRNYSYGIMTTLTGMVLDRGYRYYDWNVDSKDAGGANTSNQVYSNVMNSISHGRGNVVLMHDIKSQTRDALRSIIRDAKSNGFTFDKITMNTYMVRHGVNN